ncbi:MAG: ribulose-phosphate 3-epimerase [Anaeromicrobium sp.]|jgi:ribulose-phosphate 3-epimerase|uniref:ribulose-phosphate 3-epimerase n=1 Tax=Anaeromicrobium sp. TaxID=1929132 RepID=UPI0025F7857C|nr:ribulose-phosphate 3-epimerase [Anaeromicrobium sp.]MCT4594895.1 ribulose-phosphate 3-epimerase [Anaeromicrobium sp.]
MVKLSPSILSANFANLKEDIEKVEKAGVDMLHIDVMDGQFVPNISIGPVVLKSVSKITNLVLDVHLMIEEPDRYIKEFVDAGAHIITVHMEACTHIHRTIQLIKSYGVKAGVSLNPGTPLNELEYILDHVDMVLLMSVNPGFGGQKFIPIVKDKIIKLKKMIGDKGLNIDIEVDGGIKVDNVKEVVEAGANVIVAGSAIFGAHNIEEAVMDFRKNI